MRRFSVFICSILIILSSRTLPAQTPRPVADAEAVHREEMWDRYQIERQIQQSRTRQPEVVIGSPQPPPDWTEKSSEKLFKLNEVVFDTLPRSVRLQELEAVTARYKAMEKVSVRDLYEMIADIDALFDARHVVGRAVLPVQDVEGGIIHIQIIEGRVGHVHITTKRQPYPLLEGTRRQLIPIYRPFEDSFVRKRFHYSRGAVLNTERLENEILRFNRIYKTQLFAELEPGDDLGKSTLKVTAVAPQPVSSGFYCDNTGRDTSGKIRTGGFVQLQSVFGLDESFYCSYDKTEGTSYLVMYGDMPISARGTSIEMTYDYGTPRTLYGPFADLNITGMSRRYKPGVRQLIQNTKQRKSELFFSVENYESNSLFDQVINYREELTGYSFGISNTYRRDKSVRFTSLACNMGNAGIAGNPEFGDFVYDEYYYLTANFTQVWNPNDQWTWIVRANGQWAMSFLPQSRVFQIGGQATIRGANEGMMSGESGYLLGLEGRRLLSTLRKKGRLEAFGFFDHGGVFYRYYAEDAYPSDYLFTLGCGLMFSWGKYLSAVGGFGQPIFTAESHQESYKNSLKHGLGYFSTRLQF